MPVPVYIILRDARRRLVEGAHVVLRRGGEVFDLTDEDGMYHTVVPAGAYSLYAAADGFEEVERSIDIRRPELSESVSMGRPGQPFIVQRGQREYVETDGDRIGAFTTPIRRLKGPPAEEPSADELSAEEPMPRRRLTEHLQRLVDLSPGEIEPRLRRDDLLVLPPRQALVQRPEMEDLRAAVDDIDAGPILRDDDEAPPRILSGQIDLRIKSGLPREELDGLLAPFGLVVHRHDSRDPTLFIVRSKEVPDAEFGALPEELMALEDIVEAESVIVAPVENTLRVIPADAGFPLQYHDFVTRVPEAWSHLDPAHSPQSFGSADVLVAVHDSGVQTAGAPPVPQHPAFAGQVQGGSLTNRPGLNDNKTLFTFDFLQSPMQPDNHATSNAHGSNCSGIISAQTDGTDGTVGGAANTRLLSFIRRNTSGNQFADAFDYMAGLDPRWQQGAGYTAAEPFPAVFETGRNPVPSAWIVNASHSHPASPNAQMRGALLRSSLFGRNRRGTLVIAAAGNEDRDTRTDGDWGEGVNVLRVAASALDFQLREIRANFSDHALVGDRLLDVAAPSRSQNVNPSVLQAPHLLAVTTTDLGAGTGNLGVSAGARAAVTNTPAPGSAVVQVAPGDLANFNAGDQVILTDRNDPFLSELHSVNATAAPNTITLARNVGYDYNGRNPEIIRIDGTTRNSTQFGGTSASAPQVCAIAALMLSANPLLSWLEVRELLRRTAVPVNLRYRGSRYATGPDFRYRWLEIVGAGTNDLITADGLLDITGADRTMTLTGHEGDRIITLDATAGLQSRQALLIGVETLLDGAHNPGGPNPNQITVDRGAGFQNGDAIFIGRDAQTILIDAPAAGDNVIWVQNVDGFLPGDTIRVGTGAATETVQITSLARLNHPPTAGQPGNRGASHTGFNLSASLANAHNRTDPVRIAPTQREGPFTVTNVGGNTLTLNNPITQNHPDDRLVYKEGTELKAVIEVLSPTQVEIDPLDNDHVNPEPVRTGRVATYSLGFGFGRVDALAAVQAAEAYDHTERDLVVRNFLNDDGTNSGDEEIESPDVWVRNDAATSSADLPNYADPGPHQHPEITVDPAIYIGSGRNDLAVGGACTSANEVTFEIEIDGEGNPDTFKWSRNGAEQATGVDITSAAQGLADGVQITFAQTQNHTLGDKWIVKARQVNTRFLHIRTHNRGAQPSFARSTLGPQLDVARSRLLLCMSDGLPPARHSSIAAAAGLDDMEVVHAYTGGLDRTLFTVEITNTGMLADQFSAWQDGTRIHNNTPVNPLIEQVLADGLAVQFANTSGHQVGDRWDIYVRQGTPELNLDHFWPFDEPTPFDPTTGSAGTRFMGDHRVDALAAGGHQIDSDAWPEALRPPTNDPNADKPERPMRLYALGEIVPHDGPLAGATAKTNNNVSFRELCFAKFRFTDEDAVTQLAGHVDVSSFGVSSDTPFRVEVRTTALTFTAERVRLKLTAHKRGGGQVVKYFEYDDNLSAWGFPSGTPTWVSIDVPLEARRPDGSEHPAQGEQFDIHFDGTLTLNRTYEKVEIEPQIRSHFRDQVVARGTYPIEVYEEQPEPKGLDTARSDRAPKPASFAFADVANLSQTADQAFGPVQGDETAKYRTTALLTASADTNAYAVADGTVAVVDGPGDTVNVVIRPLRQPISGFTPVRYFVYRGLRKEDFLKAANDDHVHESASASAFITEVRGVYANLNDPDTPVPSSILGFDPSRAGSDPLDGLFFSTDIQLPVVSKGDDLGRFKHAGGHAFGFEVVLNEGSWTPTIAYARLGSHVVDVSGMPSSSDSERFALRMAREEILHFMDPAAFYGLHLHEDGKVEVDDGAGGSTTLTGEEIINQVVARFATKHTVYADIRSENGDSLNFYRNYDDGSGNQVRVGHGAPTARPYATHNWPILIVDTSAGLDATEDALSWMLRLRRDDNEEPVLYVAHGTVTTGDGPFLRGSDLHSGGGWTDTQVFSHPASGPDGSKKAVAWVLRLHYGRLDVTSRTTALPNTVLKTEADTDNIFGPIDREGGWKSSAKITWLTTQANRYVDADPAFKQMMRTGTAVEQGGRVLFYASVTDSDTNSSHEFVPIRGLTDGVSERDSCFDERGLFGAFDLDYDVVEDQGNTVRTLSLTQRPEEGYPPTNAMLLGLSEAQVNDLKALTGLSTDYKRMVVLRNRTAETDPAGNTYDRYEVGLQGLKADGTFHEVKPTSVIHVFSVDGRFFYSADFSDGEPLPTAYSRSFEESEGTRTRPAEERRIAAVDTGADEIRIANYDWTREIAPGDTVKVGKSSANDGDYTVDTVSMDGPDTVIEVQESIGSNADPLGSVFTTPKPYEDLFIDMDREGTLGGIDAMRTLVENFKSALGGVANNAGAQGNLESEVDDAAPEILRRAALLAQQDRTRADDYERALYWARIQMLVALKSHDFCLQSLSGRNALVNRFDRLSRGYDVDFSAAPGTAKKILVTGFDPFDLAFNPTATNPSSAVALALRSTGIASGDGWVESAIFPVRYEDFDAGRIETLVNPFLDGPNRVDAIVTLGQNGSLRYFDLERFAGKRRGGYSDNAQPGTVAAEQIGDGDAFYETTLPPEMVPGPFLGPPDQRIYFDESYESEDGSHPHPSAGGRNDHVQTFPLADISGAAREGSAGNDLSNEIFYRVAHRREELGSATRTGHLQVPGSDMDIQELIRLTEEMLERAVNLLP